MVVGFSIKFFNPNKVELIYRMTFVLKFAILKTLMDGTCLKLTVSINSEIIRINSEIIRINSEIIRKVLNHKSNVNQFLVGRWVLNPSKKRHCYTKNTHC
jgi:hypothetical protein